MLKKNKNIDSPYTNVKMEREDGKLTPLQLLLKTLLYLAAIIMAIAAIWTVVKIIHSEKESIQSFNPFPHGSLTQLSNPEHFKEAYLAINAPQSLLESIQTVRISGVMESGENKQPFVLIKKRPDQVLFKMTVGKNQITYGVSNDIVWRRIQSPQQKDHITQLEGDDTRQWLEQRRFFDRIIDAILGEGSIQGITTTEWDTETYLEVTIKNPAGEISQMLIDPQTMYPIVEIQTQKDGTITQTVCSDYRNISGMPIPFRMVTSNNGKIENNITLDSASINSGVLSRLFEMPEILQPELPPEEAPPKEATVE